MKNKTKRIILNTFDSIFYFILFSSIFCFISLIFFNLMLTLVLVAVLLVEQGRTDLLKLLNIVVYIIYLVICGFVISMFYYTIKYFKNKK